MKPKAFTYYEELDSRYWPNHTQWDLINVWRRSWEKAGWEAILLDKTIFNGLPGYPEMRAKIWSLPTEYGHDFDGVCMLRWLAASLVSGGGMLCDYDVMNYGFAPRQPDPEKMIIHSPPPPQGITMGAVLGTQAQFRAIFDIFLGWTPDEKLDWNPNAKPPQLHCSDASLMHRMFEHNNFPKPSWLVREAGQIGWGNPGWEKASLVHFGYEMKLAGYWPKWQHIERLRPF